MLLSYSVGSVQHPSIQDFEIFIMGDGVTDESKRLSVSCKMMIQELNFLIIRNMKVEVSRILMKLFNKQAVRLFVICATGI